MLVVGCSGGDGEVDAKPSPVASSARPSVAVPAEPVFPDTPAGRLDELGMEEDWALNEPSASEYVMTMCEEFTAREGYGADPGEWLVRNQDPTEDQVAALRAGMPELCPKWWPKIKKALGGDVTRTYSSGTYEVVADPGLGNEQIAPGTYRASDPGEDCYWERTSDSGEILANQLATVAKEITVTVRATDGFFASERCGTWKPVK